MCSKFNILLGLEGRNMGRIGEESQSSKCIHGDEKCTICSGAVQRDGGLRNFQRRGCKEKNCFNKIDIQ